MTWSLKLTWAAISRILQVNFMSKIQIVLFFFVLPIISPLIFPPTTLESGFFLIIFEIILFALLGFFVVRGYLTALKLLIFLQGLNGIVRIMMFFQHATFNDGTANLMYILTSALSIGVSTFVMLRLDQIDVRSRMVR